MPTLETARKWHVEIMKKLDVPRQEYVGNYRGEPGVENITVSVGNANGVHPLELEASFRTLRRESRVSLPRSMSAIRRGPELDTDGLSAVGDFAALVLYLVGVRVHPFANGNGRTARIWAVAIFMRYGLPPALRLRPRPDMGAVRMSFRGSDAQ